MDLFDGSRLPATAQCYMMILELAKARAPGREPAFESCGLADRIRNVQFEAN
jgi:hypothetical protein